MADIIAGSRAPWFLDCLQWEPEESFDSLKSLRRSSCFIQRGVIVHCRRKRTLDLLLVLAVLMLAALPMLLIALLVKLTSRGPVLYWSDRVGRGNHLFRMPKFRTMRVGTPALATHLLTDPGKFLTPVGSFLRKSSLDELPQLWSILKGDMSIVGPRPALFNQDDLIALRSQYEVHRLLPGLTGWAQINGRDELPIPEKVKLDVEYMNRQSVVLDLKIIFRTATKVLRMDDVAH